MSIDFLAGKIIFIIFIAICAFEDYKTKSIDLKIFIVMFASQTIWYIYAYIKNYSVNILSILIGMAIGIVIMLISKLLNGNIGIGDGYFFLATGMSIGGALNIYFLFLSLLLSAIYSLAILAVGFYKAKNMRGKSIAFIPFSVPAAIWIVLGGIIYG